MRPVPPSKVRDRSAPPAETKTSSTEALLLDLEAERNAREVAVAEAQRHRRFAEALERVVTAEDVSVGLDGFLRKLLEVLVEIAAIDLAVIRLREGNQLRSRAAIGLEEEVSAGFSLPIDEGFAGRVARERGPLLITEVSNEDLCKSPFLRAKGVQALYGLPLLDGQQLVGVIYMGSLSKCEFTDEAKHLLGALAMRATAAVVRQDALEALRRSLLSRDEVLGIVAHDLRNPIAVIMLAASRLQQRVQDPSTRRAVERILRAAQRGEHLIRDLLEINAIEGGRFAIETRPLEIATTILAAVESQQSLAASASVILSTDLSPELPSIEGDEERLLEVLENLIGNAVKFTNAGGSVIVGASSKEKEVLVWVKDTGQGIPPEQLPHLFDRFWQARKHDRRGTGLGLTICKAIVDAHGGKIWAESTTRGDTGTTMFFTIPAEGARPRKMASAPANILLVDDRTENLLSLKTILERPDYRLVTASSGQEALSLALREQFSVALIDIAMPGMDGLEVAVHMKELERSRDIPIIFITAFGDDPQEIHRAYAAGGADYLVKPLDAEIVRKKVAVFVDLSLRRTQNEREKEAE